MIIKTFYVYKLTNLVNNKLYIGKTFNPKLRLNRHKSASNNNPIQIIHKAIVKYGIDNFSFEIIEDNLSEEVALLLEISWINLLKDTNHILYNMTIGGEGTSGYHHSNESKTKISLSMMGRIQSKEVKDKISKANTGKVFSQETKTKISLAHIGDKSFNFGKRLPESTRNKISKSNLGKKTKLSENVIAQINLLILNGDTAKSISNQLNLNEKTVRKISRGKITIRGIRNHKARFTNEQVATIKQLLKENKTIASIARTYNVGESTIRHIKQGKTWKHI